MSERRAARARVLAERYPAAREALLFYGRIALFQQRISASLSYSSRHPPVGEGSPALPTKTPGSTAADEKPANRQPEAWEGAGALPYRQNEDELAQAGQASTSGLEMTSPPRELLAERGALVELVRESGPELLRETARAFDEAACRGAMQAYLAERDTTSPRSFFARVLLQPWAALPDLDFQPKGANRCPRCGRPPQVGCLRPEGDGAALSLLCSLCLGEWAFGRGRCPACGETKRDAIAYYSAAEPAHLQIQVCESCGRYFHLVNLSTDPRAVPDVDEISALPLDVWAHDKGFKKLHPSLVGI